MVHVAFLVWGDRVFMPGVKVTLDLGAAILPLGAQASAVVMHGGPEVVAEARRRFGAAKVREAHSPDTVIRALRELQPDVVFSKDHIDSLAVLHEVKESLEVETVGFTSGFYGLETLRPRNEAEKAEGRRGGGGIRRLVPFTQTTRKYRRLLQDLSGSVAISYYCEMLLELLYGVRPLGVVYPVVDPTLYHGPLEGGSRSGVLVFCGPSGNRSPSEYLPNLHALPRETGKIHLFGSTDATLELSRALGHDRAQRHVEISNEALVELYGKVAATYITSEWEGFGYVGPESILCGTPVVAEVAQPWMEITGETAFAKIARDPYELRQALIEPSTPSSPAFGKVREELIGALAPKAAGERFLQAIARV